jgi:ribosomal protein L24
MKVEMLSGKYKKKQGKVIKVLRKKNEVVVQGINLVIGEV